MWEVFIQFLTDILAGIQSFCGDWGLAVIILTIIIRIILTPLTNRTVKTQARTQIMQPKMKEIQEKYADDPMRQNEELRKLYAEMKINPLGGCLPILLQMPIFFGLFTVAKNVPADASFFSIIPSITQSAAGALAAGGFSAAFVYIAFDILFGVFTLIPLVLNLNGASGDQKTQQLVMGVVMSGMMLWFGWGVPAAVLLYYVTSSIWQVLQQVFITRKLMEKEKAKVASDLENQPLVVDVVRKEKKPRPKKSSK